MSEWRREIRMRLTRFAAPLLLLSTSLAQPQKPDQPLAFEVASVKPASAPIKTKDDYSEGYNAGMRAAMASAGMRISGTRVNITDNSLSDMVRLAYQVKDYQISAPAWMSAEKYEVVANMPAGSTRAQAPAMLQALLATRFHLRFHREQKKLPIYALVALKGGAKLTPLEGTGKGSGGAVMRGGEGRVLAKRTTLPEFADLLTKVCDRPVIESTGLAGAFDFDLTFSGDLTTDSLPALSEALAALGLKLEKRDAPVEILVIDGADKVPIEN
jgi:uncharacterized protein (TIGR03435 family)